jgi:hypothetical protein
MRRLIRIATLSAVWLAAAAAAAAGPAPRSVGGFTLDRPIEEFKDRVHLETSLPVRYMENIHEVEVHPIPGVKSGLIAYATCREPHRIVRIKLKYEDGSVKAFEELFRRFKKQFGEPGEYRGDPFKNLVVWKWSFSDAEGGRISMTLQHNALDEDEKMGNAVKLTLLNRIEEDERCFRESGRSRRDQRRERPAVPGKPGDPWDFLIPR